MCFSRFDIAVSVKRDASVVTERKIVSRSFRSAVEALKSLFDIASGELLRRVIDSFNGISRRVLREASVGTEKPDAANNRDAEDLIGFHDKFLAGCDLLRFQFCW